MKHHKDNFLNTSRPLIMILIMHQQISFMIKRTHSKDSTQILMTRKTTDQQAT